MTSAPDIAAGTGPILFAYDGSPLAAFAIDHAAGLLHPGREALVLCVWQPADVGFEPVDGRHFDADQAQEVRRAAEKTAERGASLSAAAGFRSESLAIEAAPTWKGIVDTATERGAGLVVLGSHRRTGVMGHLLGSVASAVVAHSTISVLVARRSS